MVVLWQRAILKMLTAEDENVLPRQYLARLLNTFASMNEGLILITVIVCQWLLDYWVAIACATWQLWWEYSNCIEPQLLLGRIADGWCLEMSAVDILKATEQGQHQYGEDADWGAPYRDVHIGAIWRIRLNCPGAAAMRPYVKLLWSLVIIINNLLIINVFATNSGDWLLVELRSNLLLNEDIYIGWQWRNFFISAVFRHFVGQALRNVCYSDVSRRHFLN